MENTLRRHRLSGGALVISNLFPLVGVLVLGWDAGALIFLYWAENLVIGFYNYCKMLAARGKPASRVSRWFLPHFFLLHYGIFTAVHGVFVLTLFGRPLDNLEWVGLSALFLFLSHGVSFWTHFLRGGERQRLNAEDLFIQPYPRVVVMHITILAGGFLAMTLDSPPVALAVLVALKIIIDMLLHLREHKKLHKKRQI